MQELRFSEYCANCRKSLEHVEKILFVEKEVGRCFCCEDCIRDYFQPTVEFMEEELSKLRSDGDISAMQAPRLAHYRSLTLGDPDEIWVDTAESGEHHFTYISHFRQGEERISYIVICLAIEGVPSFVFLSFPTRDEDLVDEYRRGVDLRIDAEQEAQQQGTGATDTTVEAPPGASPPGAQDDQDLSILERLYSDVRQPGDIPRERFERFEALVEPTLEDPDEIWQLIDDEGNEWYTFIAHHTLQDSEVGDDETDEATMIAVCQPAFLEEGGAARSFEVVFTFPTIDPGLVQHFRKGVNSLNKSFGVGWARGGRAA